MDRRFWSAAATASSALLVLTGLLNHLSAPAVHAQSAQDSGPVSAPSRPQFEVTSVKPYRGGSNLPPFSVETAFLMDTARGARHGHFSISNIPLRLLIRLAYDARGFQVSGGPSWVSSDRYQVDAKAAGNATFQQMRPMLQSLLADRFKLTLRRETQELPVFELAVAKGGLKLAPTKEGSCINFDPDGSGPRPAFGSHICGGFVTGLQRLTGYGITMPQFINVLTAPLNRIIIDKTGFKEKFDVDLKFDPCSTPAGLGELPPGPNNATCADSSSYPSIFAALRDGLGLQLRSAKGPVEVLVIDHVERPSEN